MQNRQAGCGNYKMPKVQLRKSKCAKRRGKKRTTTNVAGGGQVLWPGNRAGCDRTLSFSTRQQLGDAEAAGEGGKTMSESIEGWRWGRGMGDAGDAGGIGQTGSVDFKRDL
jgi:hypothetical protein